jgi:hypothetical protein
MGEDDIGRAASTATARLRLLQGEIGQLRARPQEPSGRTRNPHPAGPLPVGLVDAMCAAREEAVTHTRAANPDAGPPPASQTAIYAWMDRSTARLDAEKRSAAQALIYRHGLEHALSAHDFDVVRPETCPACGCYSLFWQPDLRRAVCAVTDCLTPAGRPSTWTLAQLAAAAVEKSPARAAT